MHYVNTNNAHPVVSEISLVEVMQCVILLATEAICNFQNFLLRWRMQISRRSGSSVIRSGVKLLKEEHQENMATGDFKQFYCNDQYIVLVILYPTYMLIAHVSEIVSTLKLSLMNPISTKSLKNKSPSMNIKISTILQYLNNHFSLRYPKIDSNR